MNKYIIGKVDKVEIDLDLDFDISHSTDPRNRPDYNTILSGLAAKRLLRPNNIVL